MTLDAAGLESDLEELFADPPLVMSDPSTADVAASRSACAQAWADAMGSYAAAVVPPSTTVVAAAAALSSALATAFASESAAAAVDAAFLAFATSVGGGMAGFVAAPPPAPPGFATGLQASQPSHEDAAEFWASLIDTWMKTGTATPISGGSPVNWS